MEKRFYCKQSALTFILIAVLIFMPLIVDAVRNTCSIDAEYLAVYFSMGSAIYGILSFPLLTAHAAVNERQIVCSILGLPIYIIDIESIKRIKRAKKFEKMSLFALSKNHITISYTGYGDKLTVALRDNEGFISTVNAVKSGDKPAELKKPDKTKSIVRLIATVFFIVANAVISLGELWQWVYTYPAVGVIIIADIVFMTMYVMSYSHDSAEG
ncbi:MAG: hypothetical protein IJ788_07565 [Oscillospiraceae bacterium]|nr:hypothetical protein [Oscillospiraceae bacterium]